MAVRRWQCHPDVEVPTHQHGLVPAVSRDALVDAVLDGVAMLDRSGGVLTVIVGRHPTDLPGEMLTTGVVVEWKDHTRGREQPEQPREVVAPVPEDPTPEQLETALEVEEPDGLDPATLAEEDDTSVPVEAR